MVVIVWKWEYEKENDSGNEKVRENSELERDFVIVRGIWNFEDENNEGESENKEGKREKGGAAERGLKFWRGKRKSGWVGKKTMGNVWHQMPHVFLFLFFI